MSEPDKPPSRRATPDRPGPVAAAWGKTNPVERLAMALDSHFGPVAVGAHVIYNLLLLGQMLGFVPWPAAPFWLICGLLFSAFLLIVDVMAIRRMLMLASLEELVADPLPGMPASERLLQIILLVYLTLHALGVFIALVTLGFPFLILLFYGAF